MDARRRVGRLQRATAGRTSISRTTTAPRSCTSTITAGASCSRTAGLESESKSGMSVALGDAFNRGRLDAFVTNISERGYLFQNNNLRLNRDDSKRVAFATSPRAQSPTPAGRGARSSVTSTTTAPTSCSSPTASSPPIANKSYWYAMSKIAGANGRLFEDAATWPAFGNASLSGYERSRVYLNRGVAGWVDVARTVGATDLYDGRAVALADLSQPRRRRRHRREPEPARRRCIAISPTAPTTGSRSRSSARAAIAARSAPRWSSKPADLTQRRVVDGGMGFASQNDRRLHFGLGRTRVGRSRRDSLAVGHAAGAAAPADRSLRHRHRAAALTPMSDAAPAPIARAGIAARACGQRAQRIDPRYLIAFLITLVLVVAQLRYHMVGGYERLARRARSHARRPRRCSPGSTAARSSICRAPTSAASASRCCSSRRGRRSGRSC